MVSSREITPKHLLLKYVFYYINDLPFILFILEQGCCMVFEVIFVGELFNLLFQNNKEVL